MYIKCALMNVGTRLTSNNYIRHKSSLQGSFVRLGVIFIYLAFGLTENRFPPRANILVVGFVIKGLGFVSISSFGFGLATVV